MANRLQHESSPYLRQHADNPIDWYPWGDEALLKAKAEDKPLFLSIGYSACHWCHVMAHESFEDSAVAALLNEGFVSIKVDREERPDLDRIYMAAVQALTGNGGWPMSIFATPEGRPFYGGTYFPPTGRHGLPAFCDVLAAVSDAWSRRRQEIEEGAGRVVGTIRSGVPSQGTDSEEPLTRDTLDAAVEALATAYDRYAGGWGRGPKFPQPMGCEFLLRHHHLTGDSRALDMAVQTLEAMARGGMYDQVGGGFHRYSVDGRWLVPHFEKMLYDNAQLARVYLHAWQVTGESFYRAIAEETLDYVRREMTHPDGGFYSTQDADSEGGEGAFFVWRPEEIRQALGEDAEMFIRNYGVSENGSFEGANVLEYVGELAQRPAHAEARAKLFAVRAQRVPPGRDEKVLASWNGLMLAAYAEAARVLGRDDYRRVAEANAAFLLRELRGDDGRLFHTWMDGRARLNGYLEDYAYSIEGLIELYQTTFEPRWYAAARELAQTMLDHFQAADGGFYDTGDDHEALIMRPREWQDNATPSGNAMAATVLLKLAGLAHEPGYAEFAERMLARIQPTIARYPLGFGQWLQAAAYALADPAEIALLGEPGAADTRALLAAVREGYRPFQVVALGSTGDRTDGIPLLRDRVVLGNSATAYVCRSHTCREPVTTRRDLISQLNAA